MLPEDLDTIIDSLDTGVCVIDQGSRVVRINASLTRITGLASSLWLNKPVTDLYERGYFLHPSIAFKALRTRARERGIQETSRGRNVAASAKPVLEKGTRPRFVVLTALPASYAEGLGAFAAATDRANPSRADVFHPQGPTIETEDGIIAKSSKMREILAIARRVAGTDATVLLLGESGVGKDVVAKLIADYSTRSHCDFLKLDCNTLHQELVESELFGYVRGAFTGATSGGKPGIVESLHHGTLFVDEVGDLPLNVQGKFLRLLEEGRFRRIGGTRDIPADVRIVAATNRDLEKMVEDGLFRKDLYYRLKVVRIYIPPLRERKEDIVPLAEFYLNHFNRKYDSAKSLSEEVSGYLVTYPWPGNVRELIHLLEGIVVAFPEDTIRLTHVRSLEHQSPTDLPIEASRPSLQESIQGLEKTILMTAMREHGSARSTARNLGISHTAVLKKLKKYGLAE